MKRILYILVCAILAVALVACDDDIATSSEAQPTLSADTLHLGTILAGNSSQTYLLKLYNKNSKELKLTSISLRDAESSGFRMNVDGMNGTSFTQDDLLRIASGDSLFMFVEATFPENGNGIEQHLDYIDIICNGKISTIVLDAYSKDVKKLHAAVISENETWKAGAEFQIYDSLVVANDVTLTLEDSVTLYMHDKVNIVVYGTLLTKGTLERPVIIRGDRTDNMFDNLPYDNLPSQWGSLYFKEESKDNFLKYTDIHGMSDGIFVASDVLFDCCKIKNSDGNLITARNADLEIRNSLLSQAAGALLDCTGGRYSVTHCTLANYNFSAVIEKEAVRLSNNDTISNEALPIYQCDFTNTLVWGRTKCPDIRLDYVKPQVGDSIFCYHFDHCLLRAEGQDDADFVSTLWNADPLYVQIEDENYNYDFHLQKESPAKNAGTPLKSVEYSNDLDGNDRSATSPTIGCYE